MYSVIMLFVGYLKLKRTVLISCTPVLTCMILSTCTVNPLKCELTTNGTNGNKGNLEILTWTIVIWPLIYTIFSLENSPKKSESIISCSFGSFSMYP